MSGEGAQAVTVVRLPWDGRQSPIARVMSVVGRSDLALTDELHAPGSTTNAAIRPYSVVRRPGHLDVAAFDDRLTRALLAGEAGAVLVTRRQAAAFAEGGCEGDALTLAFETPTLFRVAGFDHLVPDAGLLLDGLLLRWRALGWPALLPEHQAAFPWRRLAVWPWALGFETMAGADGQKRGFVGLVRIAVTAATAEQRAALWTLARFGEWRGAGKHTSYGLGRMLVVRDRRGWRRGQRLAPWDNPPEQARQR